MVTSAREKSALKLLPSLLPEGERGVDEVCSSRVVEGGTYLVGEAAAFVEGEALFVDLARPQKGFRFTAGREARM